MSQYSNLFIDNWS